MNPNYKDIGVSDVRGGDHKIYWTQVFGRR
ncbi:CAP domain-containing protein [Umezakia ovalisporum]